ncbi:MAG: sigma-70 family RNA polymerase sigma factor [Candidatus Magasanikbacteria bacterium]|jgi:RNA polymerase sigma-70 factor, ECF subfamily|nr:sigma-70 family RNA polymerase sigma factor [Candidatus Magasanikbacteria bacterium]MBT4221108.1 sigma-70 family RNA polymerase sigma factor [Candidatus Magasanikbacteria bacterium]MBT4350322.1 sigma-70 family RNA polymerase sigma factor [Candidatus Magasanikbacteria bacterium]MBT4541748.1 sigma-70 family RNA polymerase sigma factor [Candidatus Magasanikbacteria bacterium]MBT6253275.1 sigma-70 family RNA polymerase sigma factor [Candidatus Magasanikbacteria bacterium]
MGENTQIEKLSDNELVRRSISDQQYFAILVRRYEERLLRYIRRISNVQVEEAEDILQEVFLKVYRKLNDFDDALPFSSWVYRITRNQTISAFRKRIRRPQAVWWDSEDAILNIRAEIDIDKDVDQTFLREHIGEVLVEMDKKYKEVLILRFLEEKSYNEIADIVKKPAGTVATLIHRAKKQFKKIIEKKQQTF